LTSKGAERGVIKLENVIAWSDFSETKSISEKQIMKYLLPHFKKFNFKSGKRA